MAADSGPDMAQSIAKPGIIERLGERVARAMPADPVAAEKQVMGERRLQTWVLSIFSTLIASLIATVIYVFASVPGTLHELKGAVDDLNIKVAGTYRADTAKRDFSDLSRRVDAGDLRDAQHDAAIGDLSRRMDRVEYIIEVTPETSTYARRTHAVRAPKGQP